MDEAYNSDEEVNRAIENSLNAPKAIPIQGIFYFHHNCEENQPAAPQDDEEVQKLIMDSISEEKKRAEKEVYSFFHKNNC